MSSTRTYLDYNASAPLRACARAAVISALEATGNPSSVHAEGRRARAIVETAREQVAALVGASPAEVVFTSGASEANATVLGAGWDTILAARIEHDSVLGPATASGAGFVEVPVTSRGAVSGEFIAGALRKTPESSGRRLVCIQLASNETGIVQDVARIAAIAREAGAFVHCDAVQAAGRLPIDLARLGVDALTLSSHKIGGPQGAGALVLRRGAGLRPLLAGGGQERGRRAGTENSAGLAGFGAAAEAALREIGDMGRISALRDRFEAEVRRLTPEAVIIGRDAVRLPNTSALAVPGTHAETLVIRLDLAGMAVSAGAACSSGKVGPSRVLAAMGLPGEIARAAIRVSLGHESRESDINRFCAVWAGLFEADAAARDALNLERVA